MNHSDNAPAVRMLRITPSLFDPNQAGARTCGMIYLASPYSHADPSVRESRFLAACDIAACMIGIGLHVFSPIAHSHPITCAGDLPKDFAFWREQDLFFLRHCEKVVVLKLPGWQESVGIKAEVQMAQELGIPVEYVEP